MYLIVKCVVHLTHPVNMDVLLRKRICVNIYKKQSITSKLMRSFIGSTNSFYETAVIYEIVSNIPKVRKISRLFNNWIVIGRLIGFVSEYRSLLKVSYQNNRTIGGFSRYRNWNCIEIIRGFFKESKSPDSDTSKYL